VSVVRRFRALSLAVACVAATPHRVHAISTDGEATVYLTGNFSRGFNVAYDAVLRPSPQNRSTTFLGIMLIGRRNPGPGIELGLTRATSSAQSLRVFVSVSTPHGGAHFASFRESCAPACGLILRGDRYGLYAFVAASDGIHKVGSWARADFQFVRPYVQLNGEVAQPGDRIAAALIPVRIVADARDLPTPTCAFTTRGVIARRNPGGTLTFTGSYRPEAAASFIDLRTGKLVDRCPP
jgi:hypothetical protein